MRFLGWMHDKLRQTKAEHFKDFPIANCCTCLSAPSSLDDQFSPVRPSSESRIRYNTLSEHTQRLEAYSCGTEIAGIGVTNEGDTAFLSSDLFHGFLAIGTLGSEQITSSPATPTFPASLEEDNLAEENIEVTENDLNLIRDELEKFLEAEAEEVQGTEDALARSSYVSIITLSGMQVEEAGGNEKSIVSPLQGYLFGSSIELPETRAEKKKEKLSLGEIFRRTKLTDDNTPIEMPPKQDKKSVKLLLKKILKKIHAPPGKKTSQDDADKTIPTKKKTNKVLKMFCRKVHPEDSTGAKHSTTSWVERLKARHDINPKYSSIRRTANYENSLKEPEFGLSSSQSSGNTEHWIRTDADYLVLELEQRN
ncbi:unnamed protein product [Linum tenue]|uniref:LAZY1 n=1 Tax=Linum tenue TaxID=586396 RepID=A0AAV0NGR2_9ROSI|nr:unnamed protein product [Linum tenue]